MAVPPQEAPVPCTTPLVVTWRHCVLPFVIPETVRAEVLAMPETARVVVVALVEVALRVVRLPMVEEARVRMPPLELMMSSWVPAFESFTKLPEKEPEPLPRLIERPFPVKVEVSVKRETRSAEVRVEE